MWLLRKSSRQLMQLTHRHRLLQLNQAMPAFLRKTMARTYQLTFSVTVTAQQGVRQGVPDLHVCEPCSRRSPQ